MISFVIIFLLGFFSFPSFIILLIYLFLHKTKPSKDEKPSFKHKVVKEADQNLFLETINTLQTTKPTDPKVIETNNEKEVDEEKDEEQIDDRENTSMKYSLPKKEGWLKITKEYKNTNNETSNFSGMVMQGINQYLDQKNAIRRNKDLYYTNLIGNTLLMYDGKQKVECRGVIIVSLYDVELYPHQVNDNEAFSKQLPIYLKRKKHTNLEVNEYLKNDYYIHVDNFSEKEDWYFQLILASFTQGNQVRYENALDYDGIAMEHLIKELALTEQQPHLQWFNSILGRIFLSIYKTEFLKQFFIKKIKKKILKVKKPAYLGNIEIRDLSVGNQCPIISHPKLLSLSPQGELTAEMYIRYEGGFSVEIETEANLSVTTRMRPLRVPLVLSVKLKKLTGKMMLKIKPCPTNRLWIGFYETPSMELQIDPIVSDKQIKLAMVIQAIEKRIFELINESIVLPHMDDYTFFPSEGTGGIFPYFFHHAKEEESAPSHDISPSHSNSSSHEDLFLDAKTVPNPPVSSDKASLSSVSLEAPDLLDVDKRSLNESDTHSLSKKRSWFTKRKNSPPKSAPNTYTPPAQSSIASTSIASSTPLALPANPSEPPLSFLDSKFPNFSLRRRKMMTSFMEMAQNSFSKPLANEDHEARPEMSDTRPND